MRYINALAMSVLALASCRDATTPSGSAAPALQLSDAGQATLVYSNFGPELEFDRDPTHGWTINGFLGPAIGQQAIAQQFIPGSDFALRNLRVAVLRYGGPDTIDVNVQEDSSGKPGPVLELMRVGGLGSTSSVVSATSRTAPVLVAGRPYWVSLVAGGNGFVGGWMWNSIGDMATQNMAVTQGGTTNGPWAITAGLTRSALRVNGSDVRAGRPMVSLDDVKVLTAPTLTLDGPPLYYTAIVSNRSRALRTDSIVLQAWIEQGTARRAGGERLVTCNAASGVLPFGTCIQRNLTVVASNTAPGGGTLTAGPATVVITIGRAVRNRVDISDTRTFPVTIAASGPPSVARVDVVPSIANFTALFTQQQLIANVQAIGGAPSTVTWMSTDPSVATVNSTGMVLAISRGATLVSAMSTFDASRVGTSLVSVGAMPAFGTGVNVSPGFVQGAPGFTVQAAAQLDSATGPQDARSFFWSSNNTAAAVVSALGRVTLVAPGSATINVVSKADPAKTASMTVLAYDFRITSPTVPTNVSSGATLPAVNPLSVPIEVTATGPSGTFGPGITRVDFLINGGTTLIGSETLPLIFENGFNRFFKWTFTWTPGASYGLGQQTVQVRAYDAFGLLAVSPSSTLITITDP